MGAHHGGRGGRPGALAGDRRYRLLAEVRAQGTPVPPETLAPSELILPHEGSSMAEVRKLLTDEGLIPG